MRADFDVGQIFGDYLITGILSGDGTGRVYQVEHCLTKRTEAMKVLAADLASETQVKRFEREMRVLARLNHPNIAALHNAVHSESQLILFVELVQGQTLESVFNAGRLPTDTGLEYVRQILTALGYAHQQGVVHRDVTPAHVIITPAGKAKLTDFGFAKSYGDPLLTNCGEILGSLPYLAPEQLKGVTHPDRRSDLYSAGAILYEHLTGKKPFGANRRLAPVITDSEGDPQPPSQLNPTLAPEWDEIVRRALNRDPGHRYQSAEEFISALAPFHPVARTGFLVGRLRPVAIGTGIAGLLLAVVAAPAIQTFGSATPAALPSRPLHIAPPDFAMSLTPQKPPVKSVRVVHHDRAVAAAAPAAEQPAAPPPKKRFWSKLNIFKKRQTVALKQGQGSQD